LVEQETENLCVGGSIPSLATISFVIPVDNHSDFASRGEAKSNRDIPSLATTFLPSIPPQFTVWLLR
jgi:hypothetical protein